MSEPSPFLFLFLALHPMIVYCWVILESDASTGVRFVVAEVKGHKRRPVWQYYDHFDSVHHSDKKCYHICLCRDTGVNKVSPVDEKNCCITHSASNMNSLGLRIDQWIALSFTLLLC
jgi:hypothetical protein